MPSRLAAACLFPTLALVERDVAGVGRPLDVVIHGKPVRAVQVKTPFYRRPTDKP